MTPRKAGKISEAGPQSLREALYQLVHQSELPAKAQAELLNVKYAYLCDAANENEEEFCYQLRFLLPHMRITNNPVVLDYLERALGRVAIAVPTGAGPDAGELRQGLLAIVKEMGEAAGELERSLQNDGRISGREAPRCRKELWDLITAAVALYARLGEAA